MRYYIVRLKLSFHGENEVGTFWGEDLGSDLVSFFITVIKAIQVM